MNFPLSSRSAIGHVLGVSRPSSQWFLAGGVSAVNCIAAYTPKGAASLAASYDNNATPGNGLADGTYDAAPGVAPTFDTATGWTFNGSSQYLDTGVVPTTTTWSMIVRVSGWSSYGAYPAIAGSVVTATPRFFAVMQGPDGNIYYGNGQLATKAPNLTSGVLAIAGLTGYRNGSSDTAIASSTAVTPPTIYIGARHDTAAPTVRQYAAASIQALAIYAATLSAAQVAAVTAAMNLL